MAKRNPHAEWFRDKFVGHFSSREILTEDVKNFFADLAELISENAAASLSPEFFDMAENARRYAALKGIKVDTARERIIARAEILLSLHGIRSQGIDDDIEAPPGIITDKTKPPKSKVMLTDKAIYAANEEVKKLTGKNANANSGRLGLPEIGLGWSSTIHAIRDRGETFNAFLARMDHLAVLEKQVEKGILPTIKASMIFEGVSRSINNNQRMPDSIAGYPVVLIDACLRHSKVTGLTQFIRAAEPKDLEDFAVAAGLATRQGKHLIIPPSGHDIR